MRLALTGLVLIVATAATGCREPTAPEESLQFVVAPALLRINPSSGFVRVAYTIRNSSQRPLVTSVIPEVQVRNASGGWSTIQDDPNALYIQSSLSVTIADKFEQQREMDRRLVPGRYRLRANYWRVDPVSGSIAAQPQESLSNEFVVTT